MSFVEFFGFLISMFFMLFLLLRPGLNNRRRQKDPEYDAKQMEKEREVENMLRELLGQEKLRREEEDGEDEIEEDGDEDEEERKEPVLQTVAIDLVKPKPFTGPQPIKSPMKAALVRYEAATAVSTNRARQLLARQNSLKDVILIHEILSPPRSDQQLH